MIPFDFGGTTYYYCKDKKNEDGWTNWCSTKIDENGDFVEGNWGYCGSDCPPPHPLGDFFLFYEDIGSTCPLTAFFWLLNHVIYIKLTKFL